MNITKKLSFILAMILSFTFSLNSFADNIEENSMQKDAISLQNKGFEEENLTNSEMELLDEIVDSAIDSVDGLNRNEEDKELIKQLLRNDTHLEEINENTIYLYSKSNKKKPKVRISVKHAAAAFNTIASIAVVAATGYGGAVGVRLLIKKLGKKAAQNYMKRTISGKIKSALIRWGLTGMAAKVDSVLINYLYNILDPGNGLANYLDKSDRWGKNGYIEV